MDDVEKNSLNNFGMRSELPDLNHQMCSKQASQRYSFKLNLMEVKL